MGKPKKEIDGVIKSKNPRNKKNKTTILFDETVRNEWLSGFSKRKKERKKRAQHEEIEKLREQKRQVKKQKRDERAQELVDMRKAVGSDLISEIEDLAEPQVYDLPSHTVTIVDVLDPNFSGKTGLRLGLNEEEEEDTSGHSHNKEKEEGESKPNNTNESKKVLSQGKRQKKHGKTRKNRTHLMDKRRTKKKTQIPNKFTRNRYAK